MKNKNVVLTGADGDIGLEISREILRRGFDLIAITKTNRRLDKLKLASKGHANRLHVLNVNLSDLNKLKELSNRIRFGFGSIYAIINNAGIYPIISMKDYDLEIWNKVITINLTAPFILCTGLAPLIIDGGRIINISSTGAHLGSRDLGYSASKAGLLGLTKSLARNLGSRNILVNAIAPGTISTKMSKGMKKEDVEKNKDTTVLKNIGSPEEVATTVGFFLDAANTYVTGATLDVNGGLYIR